MKNMKNFTLILAFMLFTTLTTKATTWTVSNDPNSPAQYHNLQTAINNASPGDTILIGPSLLDISGYPTPYGNITLNINLVLIGAGGQFPDGANSSTEKKISYISQISLSETSASSGASGTKIIGIKSNTIIINSGFSGSTFTTGGISNILIERCVVDYINFDRSGANSSTMKNDTIRNCIILYYVSFTNSVWYNSSIEFEAISIENNVFDGAYINGAATLAASGTSLDSIFTRNNLFLDNTSYAFTRVPHMVIENNIFWKAEPTVNNTASGVTFNNNLCYSTTNTLPGTGNIGSGNINNSNPLFVNYPSQGGAFSCAHDYSLPNNSPAHNTGTDGSDIGITGGISPFFNYCAGPKVPTIKELTMPTNASSVPQGGTLNVTFKAKNKD